MGRQIRAAGLAAVLLAGGLTLNGFAPGAAGQAEGGDTVRIGLVQSLFRDVPAPLVQMLAFPFRSLMRAQTGLEGQLVTAPDCFDLGRQLEEGKVQLGVFHGIEFGWAREKYPKLQPLCIAINRDRQLYAYLVVREDSGARNLTDLKGQALALPKGSREHCRLFLDRQCARCGQPTAKLFGRITSQANVEGALDDVLRGKVQVAVVDGVSLECYRQVKPGCHARLKILQKSELFPAAVIACRADVLNAETVERFKTGMITANQNERGRELMTMWKLTAFEAIPDDYEQAVANITRLYPAPVGIRPASLVPAPGPAGP